MLIEVAFIFCDSSSHSSVASLKGWLQISTTHGVEQTHPLAAIVEDEAGRDSCEPGHIAT